MSVRGFGVRYGFCHDNADQSVEQATVTDCHQIACSWDDGDADNGRSPWWVARMVRDVAVDGACSLAIWNEAVWADRAVSVCRVLRCDVDG